MSLLTVSGRVAALTDCGNVLIEVSRKTACGHDCESCGGCVAASAKITITAANTCGAAVGDIVNVNSKSGAVIWQAAVIYSFPLLLFFAGYGIKPLWGAAGFILGLTFAVVYGRFILPKKKAKYWITRVSCYNRAP